MQASILIVTPVDTVAVRTRARALADALSSRDHRVTVLDASTAALRAMRPHDCAITLSPTDSAHLVGYVLRRRGTPWVADLQLIDRAMSTPRGEDPAEDGLRRRLVLAADLITCPTEATRQMIWERLDASAAVVSDDPLHLHRLVSSLLAPRLAAPGLRILMIGPVNSPHTEDLARAMQQRGHTVRAGGGAWREGLPPSGLPAAGIPVTAMTRPRPLWLRRLIRTFQPHVVHANWMPFAGLAALAGAHPLVAMAWGSDVYLADRVWSVLNRFPARRADVAMADSSALLERLIELGARPERAVLLNWGVDLELFRPVASADEQQALRASLGLEPGPVIISPRGFRSLHNQDLVIEAFATLRRRFPEAQLVLKHQGDVRPDLGPLTGCDRVHLVGRVRYEQMADYYRASDVCISIPSSDSSPRSVWEAMACGSACVLSDLPWVHELIRPGTHALVAPIDAESVAGAIARLLSDPQLRRSVAAHARTLVEEHRDAKREMDRLEALYVSLAGRSEALSPVTAASNTSASVPASFARE